jgi:hypothetical protein
MRRVSGLDGGFRPAQVPQVRIDEDLVARAGELPRGLEVLGLSHQVYAFLRARGGAARERQVPTPLAQLSRDVTVVPLHGVLVIFPWSFTSYFHHDRSVAQQPSKDKSSRLARFSKAALGL